MKYMFIVPLLLLAGGQAYVSWRVWRLLPIPMWGKIAVVVVMLLALLSFVGLIVIRQDKPNLTLQTIFYEFGTSWFVVLLYLVMLLGALHILGAMRVLPQSFINGSWAGTGTVLLAMTALLVGANAHYRNKVRVPLTVETAKPLDKNLRVVMVSDIHLGYHNRRADFAKWVDLINAEHPDLVLVAGDIIDISLYPLEQEQVWEEWRRLKAPVYACLGNHEYISGQPRAKEFYNKAGITLLIDSVAAVQGINIVGRDDRSNAHRVPLASIAAKADSGRFTILLDHQPYNLEEAEQAGIDFQFSGHTHRGQVWPISWITDAIYENSWGSSTRGNTQYYVSSGLGIWGPKFRIGTQSEYVVLNIKRK